MQSDINVQNNIIIFKAGICRAEDECFPDNGIMFGCVLSGEIVFNALGTRACIGKGKVFVRELSKRSFFNGSGRVAYVVADGDFIKILCDIYNTNNVTVGGTNDTPEELFDICEQIKDGQHDEKKLAYSFHKLVKGIADAESELAYSNLGTGVLIKEYIDSHAGTKLTLEELARVFFLSKTQIFRIFKAHYNESPMQYFLQKKVELAKEMLISDGARISDIAETLGFSDAKHFSKTFKKYSGMLPRDYRKEMRLKGEIAK